MKLTDAILRCSKIANKDGPMEEGTSSAIVFDNAVIVFTMNEGRSLKVEVSAGAPEIIHESIDDLLESN